MKLFGTPQFFFFCFSDAPTCNYIYIFWLIKRKRKEKKRIVCIMHSVLTDCFYMTVWVFFFYFRRYNQVKICLNWKLFGRSYFGSSYTKPNHLWTTNNMVYYRAYIMSQMKLKLEFLHFWVRPSRTKHTHTYTISI